MLRRYDIRHDGRRYIVEAIDESGERRQVETYTDWEAADRMRNSLNAKLETSGELLPERRR